MTAERPILDHLLPDGGLALIVRAHDETRTVGGAPSLYRISGFDSTTHPHDPFVNLYGAPGRHSTVLFQDGAPGVTGVNGISHEALLAVLIDRLRAFQAGPFACVENDAALSRLEEALEWLHHRTRARLERGVEGKIIP